MSEMREVKEERDTRCDSSCSVDGIAPECMPDEELLYELADLFKVFGDTTRIKILYALMEQDLCVADLAEIIGASQAPYRTSCARSSRRASSNSSATARTSSIRYPTTTCTPCSPKA